MTDSHWRARHQVGIVTGTMSFGLFGGIAAAMLHEEARGPAALTTLATFPFGALISFLVLGLQKMSTWVLPSVFGDRELSALSTILFYVGLLGAVANAAMLALVTGEGRITALTSGVAWSGLAFGAHCTWRWSHSRRKVE